MGSFSRRLEAAQASVALVTTTPLFTAAERARLERIILDATASLPKEHEATIFLAEATKQPKVGNLRGTRSYRDAVVGVPAALAEIPLLLIYKLPEYVLPMQ